VKTVLVAAAMLFAQQLGSLDGPAPKVKQHVMFVAEAQTVAANKRGVLELKFRVEDGFHVNSHTPKSELQIPTSVSFDIAENVKLATAVYPAGQEFSFAFDPSEKLDVYSNEFVVKVPVIAAAGEHELKGELKYQACDHAACYPPRSLPVDVIFQAK
jgi:DsbC/DsbD-like thiol-disulfide interchange protein